MILAMLDSVSFVPALPVHIRALSETLRPDDAAEVEAAGCEPGPLLWRSYRMSTMASTAFVGDEIAAIWGMGGCPLGRIGKPWLLTAKPIERIKVTFIKKARAEIQTMLMVCPELRGYVDARYARAIRFLEALGFDIGPSFPFGPKLEPFREYRMRRR